MWAHIAGAMDRHRTNFDYPALGCDTRNVNVYAGSFDRDRTLPDQARWTQIA
jgi:hypothetical protein